MEGRISSSFRPQQLTPQTLQTPRRPHVFFTKVELTDSLKRPSGYGKSRSAAGDFTTKNKRRRQQQRQRQRELDEQLESEQLQAEAQSQQLYRNDSLPSSSLDMSTVAFSESLSEFSELHSQSTGKRKRDIGLPGSNHDRITSDQGINDDQPDNQLSLSVQTQEAVNPESGYSQVQEEADGEESDIEFMPEQSQQVQAETVYSETTHQEGSKIRTEQFQQSEIEVPLPESSHSQAQEEADNEESDIEFMPEQSQQVQAEAAYPKTTHQEEIEIRTEQFQQNEIEAPPGSRLQEENNESGAEQYQRTKVPLPEASLQEKTDTERRTEEYKQQIGAILPETLAQEETHSEGRIEQHQQQKEAIHIETTLEEENESERMIEKYLQDDTDTVPQQTSLQEENDRPSDGENATKRFEQGQTEAVLPEASLREGNEDKSNSKGDNESSIEGYQHHEGDGEPSQTSPEEENNSENWTEQYQQNQAETFASEIPQLDHLDHGPVVEPSGLLAYRDRSTSLDPSDVEQLHGAENLLHLAVEVHIVSSQASLDHRPKTPPPKVPPPKVREILECVEIPIMSQSPSASRSKKENKGAAHDLANATAAKKPKGRETEPIHTGYGSDQDSSVDSPPSGIVSPWENESPRQSDKNNGTLGDNPPRGYGAPSHILSSSKVSSKETPGTSKVVPLPLNDSGMEEVTHLDRLKAIWSQRNSAWSHQAQGTRVGTIPLSYSPDFVFGTAMPLPNKR